MPRPKNQHCDSVILSVLNGSNVKTAAFSFGMSVANACKALNNRGIFKHYLTPDEVTLIRRHRKQVRA